MKDINHPPPKSSGRFQLPDVAGAAMSVEDLARVIQHGVESIAADLECERLIAFSYVQSDQMLRGVLAVGVEMGDPSSQRFFVPDFPAAEQAIRTRQIRIVQESSDGLPPALAALLPGARILVPLVLDDQVQTVLICQAKPGVVPRSPQWQERALQVSARAAVLAELTRVAFALQEERRLRKSARSIVAAILEGRPAAEVSRLIVDIVAERLHEERVGLYLYDGNGVYRAAALRNVSAEYAEQISRLHRPTPFTTRAVATHLPYYTPDAQNDPQVSPELRAVFQREDVTSLLIAVLHQGESIKGALVVYPRGPRLFTPAELSLFQAFSDQATLSVAIARQLEQEREEATAEERNRLAREIHDTVAQSLTALALQLETAETLLESGENGSVRSMLAAARAQSRKALEETRRAVQGLAPASVEALSLADALADETRRFSAEIGTETPLVVTGDERPLMLDQRMALLRIAQEALNNARKHASAKRVRVGLQYLSDSIVLIVEDDGIGFDTSVRIVPETAGGYGLFGMNERARLLGGEVQIESTPGWGTQIRASLPYRQPAGRDLMKPRPAESFAPQPLSPASVLENTGGAPRVVIADDHAIIRHGIRDILERGGRFRVVGEATNGLEAIAFAKQFEPDVLLMDLQMPDMDGLEGLRRLHVEMPSLPVVILTTFETETSVSEALAAGARGYLLKDTPPADLVAAVEAACRGEAQFSASVTERLAILAAGPGGRAGASTGLNDREREVLEGLAQGARNKEIAARLFLSVSTVEKHIAALFSKLEVSNRTEAVRVAVERGLLPRSPFPGK